MDKEAKINLFIYLLSGYTKAGEMENFYRTQINKRWVKEILVFLIDTGRIHEIKWFKDIEPQLDISQENYYKIVQINLRHNNFFAAISAAEFLGVPAKGTIYLDILEKALAYYVANENDKVRESTGYVISTYKKNYEIPGLG